MNTYLVTFVLGGLLTTIIVYFEASGHPLLSRIATLFPVFTWLSYLFIGKLAGPAKVSSHVLFVILGTLFSWFPYMLFIYFFVEKLGSTLTILLAILLFLILAIIFSICYKG